MKRKLLTEWHSVCLCVLFIFNLRSLSKFNSLDAEYLCYLCLLYVWITPSDEMNTKTNSHTVVTVLDSAWKKCAAKSVDEYILCAVNVYYVEAKDIYIENRQNNLVWFDACVSKWIYKRRKTTIFRRIMTNLLQFEKCYNLSWNLQQEERQMNYLFFPLKYRFYCVYVNVKCGKKCVCEKTCISRNISLLLCDTMTQSGVSFRFLCIAKMLQSADSKVWISAAKHTVFRKNLLYLPIYEIKRKTIGMNNGKPFKSSLKHNETNSLENSP